MKKIYIFLILNYLLLINVSAMRFLFFRSIFLKNTNRFFNFDSIFAVIELINSKHIWNISSFVRFIVIFYSIRNRKKGRQSSSIRMKTKNEYLCFLSFQNFIVNLHFSI